MSGNATPFPFFDWERLVLAARISTTTKLVAFAIRTHAERDGTRVWPSTARLCVECNVSYASVTRARHELVRGGLLELVRRGNRRRGRADEYRLTLAEDVLDRLKWLDPDEIKAAAQKVADARQAAEAARRHKKNRGKDQDSDTAPETDVQDSQTHPERPIRTHTRPGSGLTDDPPPIPSHQSPQRDQSRRETNPGLGNSTHHPRAREHDEPTSINDGEASDAPSPCPRCRETLEPDGYCLKCQVVMTHAS